MPELAITGVKENIARFENVIMKQSYSEAGEQSFTTAQVIDEETGNVICEAGSGGGGESDFVAYTLEITVLATSAETPPVMSGPIINQDGTVGNYLPLSEAVTANINVVSTTLENGAAMLTFIYDGTLELTTTTDDAVDINGNNVYVFGDNGKLSIDIK